MYAYILVYTTMHKLVYTQFIITLSLFNIHKINYIYNSILDDK